MKKTVLTMGLLTIGLLAVDFSQMTTEELINLRGTVAVEDRDAFRAEMQSRVAKMTPEERATFSASRQATGQKMGYAGANQPTFSDLDKDGNGLISEAELTEARNAKMAKNAEAGKLLLNAENAPKFSTIDTNGDGSIDKTELSTHQTAQMNNHINQQGQSMGQGMRQGMRQGMGQGMGRNR